MSITPEERAHIIRLVNEAVPGDDAPRVFDAIEPVLNTILTQRHDAILAAVSEATAALYPAIELLEGLADQAHESAAEFRVGDTLDVARAFDKFAERLGQAISQLKDMTQ